MSIGTLVVRSSAVHPTISSVTAVMDFKRAVLSVVCIAFAIASCGRGPADPERNLNAPVQTDRVRYNFHLASGRIQGVINYRYVNTTADTVYFITCGPRVDLTLYKLTSSSWLAAWWPALPPCLNVIAIAPGATLADTVAINSAYPPGVALTDFRVQDVAGTYRLALRGGVLHYAGPGTGGTPMPADATVSNVFVIGISQ